MRWPILILVLAMFSAAVVAYGIDPLWLRWPHGLTVITTARRLQWPLVGVAVLACMGLLGLVVSGRNRVGWALGLLPVLALLSHRFVSGPLRHVRAVEDPPLTLAASVRFLNPTDYVIGVKFEQLVVALPLRSLYHAPLVLLSGRQNRLAVFWSAPANRVLAFTASREMRGRDFEVLGTPGDALLVYDSRLGEFTNGLTGLTPHDTLPANLLKPVQTTKTSWQQWKAMEPTTTVMAPIDPAWPTAPAGPIAPQSPLPAHRPELLDRSRVSLINADPPIAVAASLVTDAPANLAVGETPVVVWRDPATRTLRAFDRRVPGDLVPRFVKWSDPKRASVAWMDTDTSTEWTADGLAVTGAKEFVGKRLIPVMTDSNLPLGVLRFWYPDLHVLLADDILPAKLPLVENPAAPPSGMKHRRTRPHVTTGG